MGLDLLLQALPEDDELLRHCRAQPDSAWALALLPGVWAGTARTSSTEAATVARLAAALAARQPITKTLHLALDRDWDVAVLVLSSHVSPHDEPPIEARHVVRGCAPLAPGATSGQGIPVMWTPPEDVARFSRWLAGFDTARAVAALDLARLDEAGVYKAPADLDDARATARRVVAALRDFYGAAAAAGFGVVAVLD